MNVTLIFLKISYSFLKFIIVFQIIKVFLLKKQARYLGRYLRCASILLLIDMGELGS